MNSRYDDLERLVRLRDSGALTAHEFELEKARVLRLEQDGSFESAKLRAPMYGIVLAAIGGSLVVAAGAYFARAIIMPTEERTAQASTQLRQHSAGSTPVSVAEVSPAPTTSPRLPPAKLASFTDGWAGHYAGIFEGAEGDVVVAALPNDRLAVNVSIGSEMCAGDIDVIARGRSENEFVANLPKDDAGLRCTLSFLRRGNRLVIEEKACSYHHGAACGFSGTAHRL